MKASALFKVILVLVVGGFSVRAQASPIRIDDLGEGPPIGTSEFPDLTFDTEDEFLHFFAFIEQPDQFHTPGSYYVLLTEPLGVSDVIEVVLGTPVIGGPHGQEQPVDFNFYSDGADGFDAAVSRARLAQAPMVEETGDWQDVTVLLGFPANQGVDVRSDLDSATVPEPASLLLLGTGLVAGVRQWRKRQANA